MKKGKKEHKLNHEITAPQVRLGEYGIISLKEALALTSDDLDLVLISETAVPPVCKLMNYEKFIYEQSKKPKNKSLDMKEVKLGPNMAENDLTYRTKHIQEFLQKGHRIKLSMRFKGREMAFVDNGMALMLRLILNLEANGVSEGMPKLEGKQIIGFLKPKSTK